MIVVGCPYTFVGDVFVSAVPDVDEIPGIVALTFPLTMFTTLTEPSTPAAAFPAFATYAFVPSCSTETITGLTPTGTVASTVPKPTASIGLFGSQFGFVAGEAALQSGMLMMLSDPGCVPSPWFSTTSCEVSGERSAHTGCSPSVPVAGITGIATSGPLFTTLITFTVPEPLFRMNARLPSSVITPYTGSIPTGIVLETARFPLSSDDTVLGVTPSPSLITYARRAAFAP